MLMIKDVHFRLSQEYQYLLAGWHQDTEPMIYACKFYDGPLSELRKQPPSVTLYNVLIVPGGPRCT